MLPSPRWLLILATVWCLRTGVPAQEAPTETPTDTPTETPTATRTFTPTPPPTATETPQPPSGCQWLAVSPLAVYSTLAEGLNEEPVGQSCTTDMGDDTVVASYSRGYDTNANLVTTGSNIVLTWDTAALPTDQVIWGGVLRVHVIDRTLIDPTDEATYDIQGDWLDGTGCVAADHANWTSGGSALSRYSACGDACDLRSIALGQDQTSRWTVRSLCNY